MHLLQCFFWHCDKNCGFKPKIVHEVKEQLNGDENRNVDNNEFIQVDYRNKVNKNKMCQQWERNVGGGQNLAKEKGKSKDAQSNVNDKNEGDVSNKGINEHSGQGKDDANKKSNNVLRSTNKSNSWKVQDNITENIKISANKFFCLTNE